MPQHDVILKVGGSTDPGKLAKSIEMTAKEQEGVVRIRAMGPHSVNQAVKALVIARQNLVAQAQDLVFTAGFEVREEQGEQITLIVFVARIVV
jgi:stage V sporulation protein SpoVS